MSHTPEPWEWCEHHFNAPPYEGRLNNECGIYPPDGECGPVALVGGKENARRIVACVNACKGIKTESLEMDVLSWITDETGENPLQRERDELLEARRACGERLIEVQQERDELRAELHRIATADPRKWEADVRDQFQQWAQNRARYALAKVGAGETATNEAVRVGKRP